MNKKKIIACIATLDTKGSEIQYIRDIILSKNLRPLIIDIGTFKNHDVTPDIPREEILRNANSSVAEVEASGSINEATQIKLAGLLKTVNDLYHSGRLDGIIGIGGGVGSNMAAAAMRELPVGVPKLLVSTSVAQKGAQGYVGGKDVMIMPSVADLEGLNRVTKKVLANAAGAICGMVEMQEIISDIPQNKNVVVMSLMGTTTDCGLRVKKALEDRGYEVIVFHALGAGGRSLEEFVSREPVAATIELGMSEVANELLGGFGTAGPTRLEAAGNKGIPQIVTPGHVGVIQFFGPETIPAKYKGRRMYSHNPQSSAILLNDEELERVAATMAAKMNKATGAVSVLIPTRGFSAWDVEGQPFYNPSGDRVFIEALKKALKTSIKIQEIDANINDVEFSDAVMEEFSKLGK
jgi:uncharacterized protein (UPF0261 family)